MDKTFSRLLNKGVTQYHLVNEVEDILTTSNKQFYELRMDEIFDIEMGKSYYVKPFPSCIFIINCGGKYMGETIMPISPKSMRIAAAHTDFPMLKIKPNCDFKKSGYNMINVEPYGGLIKETWFDRPLGVAGKVVLENKDDLFKPETVLFDSQEALFMIPSLAPHMRSANDGKNGIDVAKELVPLFGKEMTFNEYLTKKIAEKCGDAKKKILDYDLYLYIMDQPEEIGVKSEYVSSPRIDNISSVAAILNAMIKNAGKCESISIAAFFDNEEIGSRSKQGADSTLLTNIIDRVMDSLEINERISYEDRTRITNNIFMLSCDVAHATHPNYAEKNDTTNIISMGEGFVIKSSASQRYVSDSEATAVLVGLCNKSKIKYQRQANKSGMPGGQTLGPIMSSYIPALAADVGIPILAMHSAREMAANADYEAFEKMITKVLS